MKFVFEKYEFAERGRLFLGYISVNATSEEEAREIAQQKSGESVFLAHIYHPQEL
jgi:hypothetical protein